MIDSPTLDEKDRPDGLNYTGTLALGWLTDALKKTYNLFPMAGNLISVPLIFQEGVGDYSLPTDFIKDYKDGIIIINPSTNSETWKMYRRSMTQIIAYANSESTRDRPGLYVAIPGRRLYIRPFPDRAYSATLWYYSMPVNLGATEVPQYPDDSALVEFVRLRGKEWIHQVDPGTAESYLIQATKNLAAAGLGNEAENDVIPVDRRFFPGDGGPGMEQDGPGWMGEPFA